MINSHDIEDMRPDEAVKVAMPALTEAMKSTQPGILPVEADSEKAEKSLRGAKVDEV